MSNSTPFTYSVTSLNQTIAATLSHQPLLQWFYCVGEVSNLIKHRSGHWYFSLKDSESVIKAVMFKQANLRVRHPIGNGDQVVVYGSIDYYSPSGNLQIIVSNMQLVGEGALLAKLEALKKQYATLGYFDASLKKSLPKYPFTIGLIVGANSAAQADAHTVLDQRWPIAKITEYNPLVQGEQAARQIAQCIQQLDGKVDVIVVVRGGGSIEDLWAFNESEVVEAVYACQTPLISGVGHESDTTLIDYVADYRANTPTGALVAATPNLSEVRQVLANYEQILYQYSANKINYSRQLLTSYALRLSDDVFQSKLTHKQSQLLHLKAQLDKNYHHIQTLRHQLSLSNDQLFNHVKRINESKRHQFESLVAQLHALSPLATLAKGYSLTFHENKVVKHCDLLTLNDTIVSQLSDGCVESIVTRITKKD